MDTSKRQLSWGIRGVLVLTAAVLALVAVPTVGIAEGAQCVPTSSEVCQPDQVAAETPPGEDRAQPAAAEPVPDDRGELARTGVGAGGLLAVSVGALLAGLGVSTVARRRGG